MSAQVCRMDGMIPVSAAHSNRSLFTCIFHERFCCKRRLPARSLDKLLKANKRLNTAYLLKESFGHLWGYQSEGWARAFLERWRQSLKWQRLTPYEKFAAMIARHWDGRVVLPPR